MSYVLTVKKHSDILHESELSSFNELSIGRKSDADIVLDADVGISRTHLILKRNEEGLWNLEVCSQHLPVYHDGEDVQSIIFTRDKEEFQMGPYTFSFQRSEEQLDSDDSLDLDIESPKGSPIDLNQPSQFEPSELMVMADSGQIEPQNFDFSGSEENTTELNLKGEPYLKFTYETHSESIRLKGTKWTAGRENIAQIQLDDTKASRKHFTIEKVGDSFFVKDLQSANGTLLNGQDLPPNQIQPLKSGDIITVNKVTMIFEIRDLSFTNKLDDLPLQAYTGPMILTSEDWNSPGPSAGAALPHEGGAFPESAIPLMLPETVEKVEKKSPNKLRIALFGVVAILFVSYFLFGETAPKKANENLPGIITFEGLGIDTQKFVIETHNYAQELYQEGKYQLSLSKLAKIHKILPYYKDSKELAEKCENAIQTQVQLEQIAEQKRAEQKTREKIKLTITDCTHRFKNSYDIESAKRCVSEAEQLDPGNIDIQALLAGIENRIAKSERDREVREKYNKSVAKGEALFTKAEALYKSQKMHKAIDAFSTHMNSSFPDPQKLKNKSKRRVASIERGIKSLKKKFMNQAKYYFNEGDLKQAILMGERAKRADPYDYTTANFIYVARKNLTRKMRKIYTESVIEEKFGNLDLSRTRWQSIIKEDTPDGEYYKKAKRKLVQYGL